MSYNGSGAFTINTSGQPVVSGTEIDDVVFNALTEDLATGLSNAICKDGQTTVTANIPFNGHKLTGVGAATARTDAATIATIQDGTGVYVGTVGGTADAVTLTPSPAIASYTAGQTFRFIASGANTGAVTVNVSGLGAKAITKNGTTALVANDLLSGAMITVTYDGTRFMLGSQPTADQVTLTGTQTLTNKTLTSSLASANPSVALGLATKQYVDAVASNPLIGGKFTVTMSASACTIAIKTDAGNDPSTSEPVAVRFRSATETDGSVVVRQITTATSLVIPSTATLNTSNATAARLYVGVLDNAGTVELWVLNTLNGLNLYLPPESVLITTTAIAGGSNSSIIYSTTLRSNVAHRVAGYFECTQATAGTWVTSASKIQQMGPGVKRTGDIIQMEVTVSSGVATGTTLIPCDDTIPQNTEGDQYLATTFTPASALNLLQIVYQGFGSDSATQTVNCALFQDSTANALAAAGHVFGGATWLNMMHLSHHMLAGTTSATTFKIRIGGESGGTFTLNGMSGGRRFGGVASSSLRVMEVCV